MINNKYKWPLNQINHSWLDRLKLALFFLNKNNKWSIGDKVRQFEKDFAQFLGVKYVVLTSSGSTANSILSNCHKDNNIENFKREKKQVIFNGISWATNINPWIRDGFEPIFIDISLKDFCIDCDLLENYLYENHRKVSCLFITNLIGYGGDINNLEKISRKYSIPLYFDNCESSLSFYYEYENMNFVHIGQKFTHTHSFYVGHLLCGLELGCIATNDEIEYQKFLLYRNHGLIRSIKDLDNVVYRLYDKLKNSLVDDSFSFGVVGNNYRPTEITSYIAQLDFKRREDYIKRRQFLFKLYFDNLDREKFYLPTEDEFYVNNTHFCLPIIVNPKYKKDKLFLISAAKEYCDKNLIERRPIISATMTRQLIYQKYGDYKKLKNCEFITKYSFYVGLSYQTKEQYILDLTKFLNSI